MNKLVLTVALGFTAFAGAQDCIESANPLGECGTCNTKQVGSFLMLKHYTLEQIKR